MHVEGLCRCEWWEVDIWWWLVGGRHGGTSGWGVHICLSVTQRACIKSLKEFANSRELVHKPRRSGDTDKQGFGKPVRDDNFRMNTRYGRYGAAYSMVGLRCFNEELSLLPMWFWLKLHLAITETDPILQMIENARMSKPWLYFFC